MSEGKCMNTFQWVLHRVKKNRSKKNVSKESISTGASTPPPADSDITTIAIVLDGEVQEVIRSEGRLAALLLSEPIFVEVSNDIERPTIGWKYEDGNFEKPYNELPIITIGQEESQDEK